MVTSSSVHLFSLPFPVSFLGTFPDLADWSTVSSFFYRRKHARSLTRAAGAAQRVFSLMDSLPDIDIDHGIVLDERNFRGEMTIQGVEFTYQMRPDNQVRLLTSDRSSLPTW